MKCRGLFGGGVGRKKVKKNVLNAFSNKTLEH